MTKKAYAILGMLAGLGTIVLGVLFLRGSMGGGASEGIKAPYYYDSGFASFGADFYTYVTNNAAEAAKAARASVGLLKNGFGGILLALGAFMFCRFGAICAECGEEKASAPAKTALTSTVRETGTAPAAEETGITASAGEGEDSGDGR